MRVLQDLPADGVCMIFRAFTIYVLFPLLHSLLSLIAFSKPRTQDPSSLFVLLLPLHSYPSCLPFLSPLTKFTTISDIENNSFAQFTCRLKLLSLWFHNMNCKLSRELNNLLSVFECWLAQWRSSDGIIHS